MYHSSLRSLFALTTAFGTAVSLPQTMPQSTDASSVSTGAKGNATIINGNPEGATYRMVFPKKQFTPVASGRIRGIVLAQTGKGRTGVQYTIRMTNLPEEGGPFLYHVHQSPVPGDGNCTATAAHLDPFLRGEMPPCDSNLPQTCQVGDLAGKHGAITTSPGDNTFSTTYTDDFTATADDQSFIGNLSVVLHFANLTRITCGNFVKMNSNENLMTSLDDMLTAADSIPDSILIAGTAPPAQ